MDFTPILQSFTALFEASHLTQKKDHPLTVMILSPHPDDECIVGSLPLRLKLENNAHVINVAVTLGSKVERQKERLSELEDACEELDFQLITLSESWSKKTTELKALVKKHRPHLILAPHTKDHHPAHIKTGELLLKVLAGMKTFSTTVVWTEFWGPMAKPNLLMEVPVEVLEAQMIALEMHEGEVSRNPYHLRLPAWMMDNVRRGSEVVGGKGTEAGKMAFGILYRVQDYRSGKFKTRTSAFISAAQDLSEIFPV